MLKLKKVRILSALVLIALLIGCMPMLAQASGSFSAYVKSSRMKVYSDAQMNQYCGSLKEKTIVTVEAYSGDTALIRYKGRTGYAKISDMGTVESIADQAVTTCSTYVFKSASTSSARVRVGKGVSVNVLAVKGSCAMVERSGNVGYMYLAHLHIEGQEIEELPEFGGNANNNSGNNSFGGDLNDQQNNNSGNGSGGANDNNTSGGASNKDEGKKDELSTADKLLASGNLSNEETIFVFAVKKMGYNPAAACGLLANIKAESGFRPNASGDSGASYGICQWYSARKTRMINWCDKNGHDYTTLEGQLYFLQYELEKYYPSVHKYLKSVDNDAQGAYEAGYYFCYHFEAPANRASKSNTRGNTAKNTYFAKYA